MNDKILPIAEAFKHFRKVQKLNQREFGKLLGVSQSAISSIERGNCVLKNVYGRVMKMANFSTQAEVIVDDVIAIANMIAENIKDNNKPVTYGDSVDRRIYEFCMKYIGETWSPEVVDELIAIIPEAEIKNMAKNIALHTKKPVFTVDTIYKLYHYFKNKGIEDIC